MVFPSHVNGILYTVGARDSVPVANGHPHVAAASSAHGTVQQRAMLGISVFNSEIFYDLLKIPVSLSGL